MTADVSVPADNGPLRAHYRALSQAGALEYDPAQRTLLDRFDALLAALAADRDKPRSLGRLLGRKGESSAPRGIYVYGEVGRGKTMLMDLFFAVAALAASAAPTFTSSWPRFTSACTRTASAKGDGAEVATRS